MVEKGGKKGGKSDVLISKITTNEQDIFNLITKEYLTVKQIMYRRRKKKSTIYKILKSLQRKGFLNHKNYAVKSSTPPFPPFIKDFPPWKRNRIRLHGQQWSIGILYKNEFYGEQVGKVFYLDGNLVKCWKRNVEIYGGQSFYGDTVEGVTETSLRYWNVFFVRLQNELKVTLVKERAQNIKLVAQHYAEINNELSEECERTGDKIRVFGGEDGKLWFVIDNSLNLREAETVHPQDAGYDMQNVILPFFNDLREHPDTPVPSALFEKLMGIATNHALTLSVQDAYAEQIKKHLVVQERTLDALDKIGKGVDAMVEIAVAGRSGDERLLRARRLLVRWGW